MPYVEAVILESLGVSNLVPSLVRSTSEDITVDGKVSINAWDLPFVLGVICCRINVRQSQNEKSSIFTSNRYALQMDIGINDVCYVASSDRVCKDIYLPFA